jgi:hypothetical protein
MKRLLVTLATIVLVILSHPLVSYSLNFSGFGTATMDGVINPGEWDNAAMVDFQAAVPTDEGGGTTPATLYVMNDGLNMYFALKIARSSFGPKTDITIDFDSDSSGLATASDDHLEMYVGNSILATLLDKYRYICPGDPVESANCITTDTDSGRGILPAGTNDGTANAKNNGSYTVIEFSHLLKSGDNRHDFSLQSGDTVGFKATLLLTSIKPNSRGRVSTDIPVSGSSIASGGGYGQITIASNVVTRTIDTKPGGLANTINTKSKGKIPVVILSTADFNAPVLVVADRNSLTFGRTGNERSLAFCDEGSHDVNGDGLPDLTCHFMTELTGFQDGDTFGILNGRATDGTRFTATDSIRTVH